MAAAASAAGSYLEFLNLLLTLGPKLGQIMPIVLSMIESFKQLFALIGKAPTPAAPVALSVNEEEAAAEQKLFAAMKSEGDFTAAAFGDGGLLRGLFGFLKSHPELLGLLLKLIKPV